MDFDPVNKPVHYNQGGIECLDAMEASMTEDEFLGYLKGNVFKYLWRWRHKGKGAEDLGKAQFYLAKLNERVKAREKAKASPAAAPNLTEAGGPVMDQALISRFAEAVYPDAANREPFHWCRERI